MSAKETALIARSAHPVTTEHLRHDMQAMGLRNGETVILHCALSKLGWVSGGARSIIEAVLQILGPDGTLVMPAQSGDLSDPASWQNPPVPRAWWSQIRQSTPPFDPRLTPTYGIGRVPELFRLWPETQRSFHPTCSFSARGPLADIILKEQPLDDPFGESSPLARLYEIDARVLMLGVGFQSCTALHLAERRVWPQARRLADGSPMIVNGEHVWVEYSLPETEIAPFAPIEEVLRNERKLSEHKAGSGNAMLASCRDVIDTAVMHWRSNRA
ncbi:AAC(3) family N-acetyltransferase [Kozakia baliensis]|uniref:aminoglycoside N(3)-acetyltransferase n=1 Tax=Kozakia baliensis TaxID=153496 RepID=UPI00345C116B